MGRWLMLRRRRSSLMIRWLLYHGHGSLRSKSWWMIWLWWKPCFGRWWWWRIPTMIVKMECGWCSEFLKSRMRGCSSFFDKIRFTGNASSWCRGDVGWWNLFLKPLCLVSLNIEWIRIHFKERKNIPYSDECDKTSALCVKENEAAAAGECDEILVGVYHW